MGSCESQQDVESRLEAWTEYHKKNYEAEKESMAQMDLKTRVPHLLVEIRSLGFVEIQGKNTGGIYDRLDEWLTKNWRVKPLDKDIVHMCTQECCGYGASLSVAPMEDWNRLCDRSYVMGEITDNGIPSGGVYRSRGTEGENNMGKLTMQLVNFMTNECGWTFHICDGGNLGYKGGIREQQIKFKAPHPLNLIAPHIMIELRQVGYVEINGPNTDGIHEKLSLWLTEGGPWRCRKIEADPDYCDLKFQSGDTFQQRGSEGENNMGMRTMELVDFMVKECAWTMVTCNGGNYGRKGDKREQQLVFRNDEFVQHGLDHVMVELRDCGYIEVNGLHDVEDVGSELDTFIKETWGCKDYEKGFWESSTKFCDKKYQVDKRKELFYTDGLTNNLGKLTLELSRFFQGLGWQLLLCNGGSITPHPRDAPNLRIREQQIKFTRAKSQDLAKAPLLMIELRTDPYDDCPPQYNAFIEVSGENVNGIYEKLTTFLQEQFSVGDQGHTQPVYAKPHCDMVINCQQIRLKECEINPSGKWDGFLNGENNLGKWTMRLCDFMVDHIGEWDLIVCNADSLDRSWRHGAGDNKYWMSVTAREMQLVFRHRPGGKGVYMSKNQNIKPLGRAPLQPPAYWSEPCKLGQEGHKIIPGTPEELGWIQELLDKTFKQKSTRDRHEELADRFVAVLCVRSEQPALWDRYASRRQEVHQQRKDLDPSEFDVPKTMQVAAVKERCFMKDGQNPSNQAYLLHGTHPTMALAILGSSFTISTAGMSAGTMFGAGVYLAESSTKADEYARHDDAGEYDGLYACLICRAALGRPFVTEKGGDFGSMVISGEYDHVLGDREKAVGTFREFVLFHETSIYPEYAVFYRREKDGKVIPPPAKEQAPTQETMEGEAEEI